MAPLLHRQVKKYESSSLQIDSYSKVGRLWVLVGDLLTRGSAICAACSLKG